MPMPKVDMYNTIFSTHFFPMPSQTNHSDGRPYSNHSNLEVCRMIPRNGDTHFSFKKEFGMQSHSATAVPNSGSKQVSNGQFSGKTYYNKKEYWNSKNQGKSRRLQYGNSISAPCLTSTGTDESGDSGISRSPTPSRSRHVPNKSSSDSEPLSSCHSEKEYPNDLPTTYMNGEGQSMSRNLPPPRRENHTQAKRKINYNNNSRNPGSYSRYRRPPPANFFFTGYHPFYSQLFTPALTPPDRFLSRAHLMQVNEVPKDLLHGSVWDQLSHSTWSKFCANQQNMCTYEKKILLWKHLFLFFKQYFPKHGLYLVGSTMNGFGSNYSDVDLCFLVRYAEVDQRNEALSYLSTISKYLERCDFVEKLELIQAKVPLLKFRYTKEGLQVDLNCNNPVGIRNTHLLYCYGQLDWRVKPLVLVVKLWAQWHNINDAKCMTMSSYSIVLMVIHFLQCGVKPHVLPCLHSMYPKKFSPDVDIIEIDIHEQLDPYESENKQPLGELLLQFFQYYASFDYLKYAISVRLGSVMPVEECRIVRNSKNDPHHWKFLCIEEPFDLTNTARSVYDPDKFEHIRSIIMRTAQVLMKTKKLDSIFYLDGS